MKLLTNNSFQCAITKVNKKTNKERKKKINVDIVDPEDGSFKGLATVKKEI